MNDYRLVWIGRDDSDCQWLLEQFLRTCAELGYSPTVLRQRTLDTATLPKCDRIVLVSASRSDSPHGALEALSSAQSIVPCAVVTGSWRIGSRRSGDGPVTHWQQPWFRWHDGWLGWFFPEAARPDSLVPNAYGPIVTAADYALPARAEVSHRPMEQQPHARLAIVSACAMTADMLRDQALVAGWQADVYRNLEELPPPGQDRLDALLWDDSLLPCLPDTELADEVGELVSRLTKYVSAADLIASLDLSRLYLYEYLRELDCCEMLIKPSYSLALGNCLYYRAAYRQVA